MYFYTEPQRKIISHCSQHESIWCLYFVLRSVKVIIVVHVYYASSINSRRAATAARIVKKATKFVGNVPPKENCNAE